MMGFGVPAGAINSVPEVFEDPQVKFRDMLKFVPHPSGVLAPQISTPMRFADAQLVTSAAAPLLGQHSDDILRELGYNESTILALRESGTV